jgi:SAM-dependent methyltransferase
VSDEVRALRAASFGSVAEAYERARPGYPDEAVSWLLGKRPLTVVDVGAGTGKLTRQLVAAGHEVVAVEPLAEMRAQLRAVVPEARALAGSAEAIPLPSQSADAVVAAQAFHWFDDERALPEIARVLRSGGVLGLIWNMRDDSVEWMARLSALLGAERIEYAGYPSEIVARSGLFEPVEHRTFPFSQRFDRETLRALVASRSYVATLAPDERETLLAAVDRIYDDAAGPGGAVVPYVTHAFRGVGRVDA